jgi:hypothetical protein
MGRICDIKFLPLWRISLALRGMTRLLSLRSSSLRLSALLILGLHPFTGEHRAFAEAPGLDPADLSVPVSKKGARAKAVRKPNRNPVEFAPPPATAPSTAIAEPAAQSSPGGNPSAPPSSAAANSASSVTTPSTSPAPRNWGITASLGFPHPFFLEAVHRIDPTWSAGLGLGGVHLQNIQWDGQPLEVNMLAADAHVRWHPWGGSFFAGLALGAQKFDGAVAATVPVTVISPSGSQVFNIYTTVIADVTSLYLTPHLGWFKVYESGLILGFELGLQIPASVRTSLDISTDSSSLGAVNDTDITATQEYKSMEAQVQDAVETFGKTPLPYFTVIRVGWMF